MVKSPLFWGIIVSILSIIGWVISIVLNVLTLGEFRFVSNVLGIVALVSLPLGIIGHFIKRHGK